MVGFCTFQEIWLDNETFKYWLMKHLSDKHKAVCKLCNNEDFSILKMGVSAIMSHMNGKNHQRVKHVTSPLQSLYFKPKEPDEIDKENCSDCVPSTSSATKDVVIELKIEVMISVRALKTGLKVIIKRCLKMKSLKHGFIFTK